MYAGSEMERFTSLISHYRFELAALSASLSATYRDAKTICFLLKRDAWYPTAVEPVAELTAVPPLAKLAAAPDPQAAPPDADASSAEATASEAHELEVAAEPASEADIAEMEGEPVSTNRWTNLWQVPDTVSGSPMQQCNASKLHVAKAPSNSSCAP